MTPAYWHAHETSFSMNNYDGLAAGEAVCVLPQSGRWMLSAPHAVNHYRDGGIKKADRMTGGLVTYLGKELGFSFIANQRRIAEIAPGESLTPIEKHIIAMHPVAVLDIHSAHPENDFDLCIGTGPGLLSTEQQDIALFVERASSRAGLRCVLNRPHYSALIPDAMTRRLKERCFPAIIQIEVNAALLRQIDGAPAPERLIDLFNELGSI